MRLIMGQQISINALSQTCWNPLSLCQDISPFYTCVVILTLSGFYLVELFEDFAPDFILLVAWYKLRVCLVSAYSRTASGAVCGSASRCVGDWNSNTRGWRERVLFTQWQQQELFQLEGWRYQEVLVVWKYFKRYKGQQQFSCFTHNKGVFTLALFGPLETNPASTNSTVLLE